MNLSYGYQTEVGFYEHIAPLVELRTARCYYGEVDSESGEHVLLLEDLTPAQCGQRAAGCSLEQAEQPIREIFQYCLCLMLVEAGKMQLKYKVAGEASSICVFETAAGDTFSATHPSLSQEEETEVIAVLREILIDEGLL